MKMLFKIPEKLKLFLACYLSFQNDPPSTEFKISESNMKKVVSNAQDLVQVRDDLNGFTTSYSGQNVWKNSYSKGIGIRCYCQTKFDSPAAHDTCKLPGLFWKHRYKRFKTCTY